MSAPLVSVILPFFNNAATLGAAIRSILRQSVPDFELILVDDGSEDGSLAVARRFRDPRIRLLRNERNRGQSYARNRGLDAMRGRFVAPMDGDDVSRRRRLEWTLEHLRTHPEIGVCGGRALYRGWGGPPFIGRVPWGEDMVRAYLLFGMPAPHDTLLFRTEVLREHGLRYDEQLSAAVDYDLYDRCAKRTGVDNVRRVLAEYRFNPKGIVSTRGRAASERLLRGLRAKLLELFPEGLDDETLRSHARWGRGTGATDATELSAGRAWLERLQAANRARQIYSPQGLARATGLVWFRCCRNSAHLGAAAWRAWLDSPWRRQYRPEPAEILSFLASGLLAKASPSRRQPQGALAGQ